jgi:hypothetical protein
MTGLGSPGSAAADPYYGRCFDVAYERATGNGLVVFSSAGAVTPRYVTWDPVNAQWSAVQSIGLGIQGGTPWWIKMAANPVVTSTEIAVVTIDTAGSPDVFAYIWDGTSFNTSNVQQLTATGEANGLSIPRLNSMDVAYETKTGRAMFAWSETANTTFRYAFWMSSMTAWDFPAAASPKGYAGRTTAGAGSRNWQLRLASDPSSNRIGIGIGDNANDLYLNVWDGSAWGTTNGTGEKKQQFTGLQDALWKGGYSLAWESSGDQLVAFVADSNISNIRTVYWKTGNSDWLSDAFNPDTGGVPPEDVKAYSDPYSDQILLFTATRGGGVISTYWDGDPFVSSGTARYYGSNTNRRSFSANAAAQTTSIITPISSNTPTTTYQQKHTSTNTSTHTHKMRGSQ